jgi:hypothetical protein
MATSPSLECHHRARPRLEEQIKDSKDTGMAKLPFRDFEVNAVWLELVLIAHDLLSWSRRLPRAGATTTTCLRRIRDQSALRCAERPLLVRLTLAVENELRAGARHSAPSRRS